MSKLEEDQLDLHTNSQSDIEEDKVYVLKSKSGRNSLSLISGALFSYTAILCILYGVISFSRPELLELISQKVGALIALIFGVGVVLSVVSARLVTLGSSSFEKAKSAFTPPTAAIKPSVFGAIGRTLEVLNFGLYGSVANESKAFESGNIVLDESSLAYGAPSGEAPFEAFMSNILKSISAYAESSENTANKLLDKGVAFMAGGLAFYIGSIIVWQLLSNLVHPEPRMMYIGMAACSMTFIVIEFLAAWFFKQYRYYVEVSLSCLRVRSVYDRYLLGYYAIREYKSEGDEKIRDQLIKVLSEDVGWPSYKKGSANDFNYMIETMAAAHTSLEKMKGVFQSKKEGRVKG